MTDQHSITPPPEMVKQSMGLSQALAIAAAFQAGADQELEACCKWLDKEGWSGESRQLRAARRPKPPSLKEQAIAVLEDSNLDAAHHNILLRALEQLND